MCYIKIYFEKALSNSLNVLKLRNLSMKFNYYIWLKKSNFWFGSIFHTN